MNRIILALVVVCTLSACDFPRGESRTLDQVSADARGRYTKVVGTVGNSEISATLGLVQENLDALVADPGSADRAQRAQQISNALYGLFHKAGQPSRPAIFQLAQQFAAVSTAPSVEPSVLELLASRTYLMLASEVETTGFRVAT